MDDDRNRKLSLDEFRKGVDEYGLNFSRTDVEDLFRLIDADRDGSIDYEEFLRKLRVDIQCD
jgi:calcyphosin